MSIGFKWQDDGSVIVTCGGETLHISRSDDGSPQVGDPPPTTTSSEPFIISGKPTSGPLAVKIKLGDEFHGTYTLDVFKGMQRIAKTSELSGLITEHMAGMGAGCSEPATVNLEWASDEPVLVHDLTKRLGGQFAGPVSIQLMPRLKKP